MLQRSKAKKKKHAHHWYVAAAAAKKKNRDDPKGLRKVSYSNSPSDTAAAFLHSARSAVTLSRVEKDHASSSQSQQALDSNADIPDSASQLQEEEEEDGDDPFRHLLQRLWLSLQLVDRPQQQSSYYGHDDDDHDDDYDCGGGGCDCGCYGDDRYHRTDVQSIFYVSPIHSPQRLLLPLQKEDPLQHPSPVHRLRHYHYHPHHHSHLPKETSQSLNSNLAYDPAPAEHSATQPRHSTRRCFVDLSPFLSQKNSAQTVSTKFHHFSIAEHHRHGAAQNQHLLRSHRYCYEGKQPVRLQTHDVVVAVAESAMVVEVAASAEESVAR
jgi:hypothetical protein